MVHCICCDFIGEFLSLKIIFVLVNSVDPIEILHLKSLLENLFFPTGTNAKNHFFMRNSQNSYETLKNHKVGKKMYPS